MEISLQEVSTGFEGNHHSSSPISQATTITLQRKWLVITTHLGSYYDLYQLFDSMYTRLIV